MSRQSRESILQVAREIRATASSASSAKISPGEIIIFALLFLDKQIKYFYIIFIFPQYLSFPNILLSAKSFHYIAMPKHDCFHGPDNFPNQRQPVRILNQQIKWENLYFYQKTVILDQMTYVFCRRFLEKYGDRTVDQMIQAVRSCKQNIVEGCASSVTSAEMGLKLLNVARASLKELQEDYIDYLRRHSLVLWNTTHQRYNELLAFCRTHNDLKDYQPLFDLWSGEEFANWANTLCHMVDKMIFKFLTTKEIDFTEHGGIRERMTIARLAKRQMQCEEILALKAEIARLQAENSVLRRINENKD